MAFIRLGQFDTAIQRLMEGPFISRFIPRYAGNGQGMVWYQQQLTDLWPQPHIYCTQLPPTDVGLDQTTAVFPIFP